MIFAIMAPCADTSQVLTSHQPFHDLSHLEFMLTVARGGHPKRPPAAESLGFSDELWELLKLCWSESSSARPTAERLFDHLSHASLTWVSPPPCPVTESDIDPDPSSPFDIHSVNSTNEV